MGPHRGPQTPRAHSKKTGNREPPHRPTGHVADIAASAQTPHVSAAIRAVDTEIPTDCEVGSTDVLETVAIRFRTKSAWRARGFSIYAFACIADLRTIHIALRARRRKRAVKTIILN